MADSREGFAPENATADVGDPAEAFDVLRRTVEDFASDLTREMTTIRKGVEAAFEEFEKVQPPTDYGPDLGRIVQHLAGVAQRLEAVEKSPALRNGPEHYARVLENAGNRMTENASRRLDQKERGLERVRADLSEHIRSARERRQQNWWLWGASGVGLVAGILLTLFLPAVLPFQIAPRVASLVMAERPWEAGMSLMAFDSPAGWDRVAAADQLILENQEDVAACREAAARNGAAQPCTITVPATEQ